MLNTSDKPISPMLQRMIEDMTARRYKEKVRQDTMPATSGASRPFWADRPTPRQPRRFGYFK